MCENLNLKHLKNFWVFELWVILTQKKCSEYNTTIKSLCKVVYLARNVFFTVYVIGIKYGV